MLHVYANDQVEKKAVENLLPEMEGKKMQFGGDVGLMNKKKIKHGNRGQEHAIWWGCGVKQ